MDIATVLLLRPDDAAAAGIMAFGCIFWLALMAVGLAVLAFQVWLFWRIFSKAGYSGSLSLLILLPGLGALIVLCILAFGEWPIHRGR
jgi:hypothetical protein